MNWKNIRLAECNTHFTINGNQIFGKTFLDALKFHAPGLAPVKSDEGWYHINTDGNEIYSQRYLRAFGYYCNRASVISEHGWLHIDEKGQHLSNAIYKWAGNFQEDLCSVRDKEDKYFHVKLDGSPAYKMKYIYAGDFKDGYACVKTEEGWQHINTKGKELNGKKFNDLGVFHKGIAAAKDHIGWFHINKDGSEIYPQRYLFIEPFYNGIALVSNFNGVKELINEQGKTILEIK